MRMLVALLALVSATALAADEQPLQDPERWMTRIVEAAREVSYHGEVVQLLGSHRVQAMEIVRSVDAEGYRERLMTLDGVSSEVVRDGRTVTCILPDGRESLGDQRVPRNPIPGQHWEVRPDLASRYEFLDLGRSRVAGRACRVIGLKPRDDLRYGHRLWVDEQTGLVLKADILDEAGETIERAAFTRIDMLDVVEAAALEPTLSGETLSWTVSARDKSLPEDAIWVATDMPPGFRFDGARSRRGGVEQQVFTDGIATISIFVGPVSETGLQGSSRMGAVSAFGMRAGDLQVTVVGEVPVATVRAIGESLRLGR